MKMFYFFVLFVVCCFFCLNFVFAEKILGTAKIDSAPYVKEGVVYEDDMYGKVDYKFYKLNISNPSNITLNFNIEPGSVNQAIRYQFFTSRSTGFIDIRANDFYGNDRSDTRFKDSFVLDKSGEYLLKIQNYNSRFLGNYDFKYELNCIDSEFSKNSSYKCVNFEWALKDIEPEVIEPEVVEDVDDNVEKVLCDGCLIDDACYQVGKIINETFCSDEQLFTRQGVQGDVCSFNYECLNDDCKNGECAKKGFFDRLIDILKNLF